ncbi:hypothetical protein NMG60_11016399 [Bertholletia excelsa]
MSFSHHEQQPSLSKGCKFIASAAKDALTNCHACSGWLSSAEEEDSLGEVNDEQEAVVLEIKNRAMEAKSRRKASFTTDNVTWVISPTKELLTVPMTTTPSTKELITAPMATTPTQRHKVTDLGRMAFFSVGSCLSRCSSAKSEEAFLSVKTSFSRRLSLVIQELPHCTGWPFGFCRKTLLIPPLPKSPPLSHGLGVRALELLPVRLT